MINKPNVTYQIVTTIYDPHVLHFVIGSLSSNLGFSRVLLLVLLYLL